MSIISPQQALDDTRSVLWLQIVCNGTQVSGQNVWHISLVTSDGHVQLSMKPEPRSINGKFEISYLSGEHHPSALRAWDFAVHKDVTVNNFIQRALDQGLDRYRMRDGRGCRYWL